MDQLRFSWAVTCEICDTDTDVFVYNEDEKPAFCAMCGESVITVELNDTDTI